MKELRACITDVVIKTSEKVGDYVSIICCDQQNKKYYKNLYYQHPKMQFRDKQIKVLQAILYHSTVYPLDVTGIINNPKDYIDSIKKLLIDKTVVIQIDETSAYHSINYIKF